MSLPSSNPATIHTAGGADYTTVAAWEADLDDATFDDDYEAQITGLTGDNATVWFNGINTTASYKVILKAALGEEADGTDGAGAQSDVAIVAAEATDVMNMNIEGIEFHTGGYVSVSTENDATTVNITKCVFRTASLHGINIGSISACTVNVGVCLFRNVTTSFKSGIALYDTDPTVQVFNCTFYDCYYGVRENSGSYSAVKNCVAMECSSADYSNILSNQSYNCSSDTTATGTGSLTSKTYTDQWTAPGTDDFTIKDDQADIYHAGVVISGESWFPSTDLAGTAWASPNPSMGCFEFVEAGSSLLPISLTGSAEAVADAEASLSKKISVQSDVDALAEPAANLSVEKSLDASADGIAAAGGALSIRKDFSGSIDCLAASTGEISILRTFSGSADALAESAGIISLKRSLAGSADAIADAQGSFILQGIIRLSGSVDAVAGADSQLTITRQLSAFVNAIAENQAQIIVTEENKIMLTGSVNAMADAGSSLSVIKGLSGEIEALAEANGKLSVKLDLSGNADAIATAIANLTLIGIPSLGVVIDPAIESITIERVLKSITVKRIIEPI